MTRIAVLGVGLIGGSIGLAARRRAEGAVVAGWDPDPRALERALERGAIDDRCASVEDALGGAEICFVCAPVSQVAATARAALECGGDCVVTDVGSVKLAVLEELAGAGLPDSDL
jgi:prephenate dehydrogenase